MKKFVYLMWAIVAVSLSTSSLFALDSKIPFFWSINKISIDPNDSTSEATLFEVGTIAPKSGARTFIPRMDVKRKIPEMRDLGIIPYDGVRWGKQEKYAVMGFLASHGTSIEARGINLNIKVLITNFSDEEIDITKLWVPIAFDGEILQRASCNTYKDVEPLPSGETNEYTFRVKLSGEKALPFLASLANSEVSPQFRFARAEGLSEADSEALIAASKKPVKIKIENLNGEVFLWTADGNEAKTILDFLKNPTAKTGANEADVVADSEGTYEATADSEVITEVGSEVQTNSVEEVASTLLAMTHIVVDAVADAVIEAVDEGVTQAVANLANADSDVVTETSQEAEVATEVASETEVAPSIIAVSEGNFPLSIAGWDNGNWDMWWKAELNGAPIAIDRALSLPLNGEFSFSLTDDVLSAMPSNRAILENCNEGLLMLGIADYNSGNIEGALEKFAKVAEAGLYSAKSWYGRLLLISSAEDDSKDVALEHLTFAAMSDYAPAQMYLAQATIEENPTNAVSLLEQCYRQVYPEGAVEYAKVLLSGKYCAKNDSLATDALLVAAKSGNIDAASMLASKLLDTGDRTGAKWLFLAAIDAHNKYAEARLGKFYRDGELGTERNYPMALAFFNQAASKNEPSALCALGELNRSGIGTPKNLKKAVEYFKKSSDLGSYDGSVWYAISLLEGAGIEQNIPEAIALLEKAAENGQVTAKCVMGICLIGGFKGIEKDVIRAFGYFSEAADMGDAPSAVFAGHCLLNGIGTKRDSKAALALFEKAAQTGLPLAKEWVKYCRMNGIGR